MPLVLVLLLCLSALAQNPNTAVFPGSVATDSTLPVMNNSASTTINDSDGITAADTTITLTSVDKFVAPIIVTIENEKILCSTRNTGPKTLSGCTRGWAGTTAATHANGKPVYAYIEAYQLNQLAAEIKAIEAWAAAAGGSLPSMTGKSGYLLTNDGTSGGWANLTTGASGALSATRTAGEIQLDIVPAVIPQLSAANSFTGINTFAAIKPAPVTSLTTTDCDESTEVGRLVIKTNATSGQQVYVCEDKGGGTYAWTAQAGSGGSATWTDRQIIPWNDSRSAWNTPATNSAQTETRGPSNGGPRRWFLYFPKAATPANTSIAYFGRIPEDAVTSGNRITNIGFLMGAYSATTGNIRMQVEMKCFADSEDALDGTGRTTFTIDVAVPATLHGSTLATAANPAPSTCTQGKQFWLNITRLAADAGDTTATSVNAYLNYLVIDFARTR